VTENIDQLIRDAAAFAREEIAARVRDVARPAILDAEPTAANLAAFSPSKPLSGTAAQNQQRIEHQFGVIRAEQEAAYVEGLLAKDGNRLTDSERQYLTKEALKSIRLWEKGELE
jgi:hypothetical protein